MRRTKKLWKNIQLYLEDSSAHGFKYIGRNNSAAEKLLWIVLIAAAFYVSSTMILTFWKESVDNPMSTVMDTKLVKNVPFPTVTINSDSSINPWGFIERFYNQYEFADTEKPYETLDTVNASKSVKMIDELKYLVVREMLIALSDHYFYNSSFEELTWTYRYDKRFPLFHYFKGFSKSVAKAATISFKSSLFGRQLIFDLKRMTALSFGRITDDNEDTIKGGYGENVLQPTIEKYANALNLTIKDYGRCFTEKNCAKYKRAYTELMAPLVLLSASVKNEVPTGYFLSYFVRLLTKANTFKKFTMKELLDNIDIGSQHTAFRDMLFDEFVALARGLTKNPDFPVNLFDIARQVDRPAFSALRNVLGGNSEETAEASNSIVNDHRFNCKSRLYLRKWAEAIPKMYGGNGKSDKIITPRIPCLTNSMNLTEGCCKIVQALKEEYLVILKVMKYAVQQTHFNEDITSFHTSFHQLDQLMPYQKHKNPASNRMSLNPRIVLCRFNGRPLVMTPEHCDLFKPTFTTEGIGYSFNQESFWTMYTETGPNKAFYNTFVKTSQDEASVRKGTTGITAGLDIMIRLNAYAKYNPLNRGDQLFKVVLSPPNEIPDMRTTGMELQPGFSYLLSIRAGVVEGGGHLRETKFQKRNCKFRFENEDLSLFKEYTQGHCTFECVLRSAAQTCNCIPWDYPQINITVGVCDYMGAFCFDRMMADNELWSNCECPFDCERQIYEYFITARELDPQKICHHNSEYFEVLGGDKYNENYLMAYFEELMDGNDAALNKTRRCEDMIQEVALVKFFFSTQLATLIKRDVRVTTADYVSNFGGTLGLFTGMSILTIIEAAFWIIKFLAKGFVKNVARIEQI